MWGLIATIGLVAALFVAAQALGATLDPDAAKACIDVQIGNGPSAYFARLNEAFQQKAQRDHATPPSAAPVDAHSSLTKVGTFDESAARRPKPVFDSPVVPPTRY